jgi:hypothetical protein
MISIKLKTLKVSGSSDSSKSEIYNLIVGVNNLFIRNNQKLDIEFSTQELYNLLSYSSLLDIYIIELFMQRNNIQLTTRRNCINLRKKEYNPSSNLKNRINHAKKILLHKFRGDSPTLTLESAYTFEQLLFNPKISSSTRICIKSKFGHIYDSNFVNRLFKYYRNLK